VSFEESPGEHRGKSRRLRLAAGRTPEGAISFVELRLPSDVEVSGDSRHQRILAGLSARVAASGAPRRLRRPRRSIDALDDYRLERREVARINDWVRSEGLTGVLTVKADWSGDGNARRADLIQYVTDAVVLLENKLHAADLSRTLRIVKYRGSGFAANAVPVVIGSSGMQVIPAGTAREGYQVFAARVSTGVARLDAVLGGGPLRASSILVTGAPGTAKTSLAASMVGASCAAGRRAVFVSFDESDAQIIANMKSIGLDLGRHVRSGQLRMLSLMSAGNSPEECFLRISELVRDHGPSLLVVDPMSTLSGHLRRGNLGDLINLAKKGGITFLGTSLIAQADGWSEESASHVSTVADVWIHLSYVAQNGERNRAITIIKARGTEHSNQVRELSLGPQGIDLIGRLRRRGTGSSSAARGRRRCAGEAPRRRREQRRSPPQAVGSERHCRARTAHEVHHAGTRTEAPRSRDLTTTRTSRVSRSGGLLRERRQLRRKAMTARPTLAAATGQPSNERGKDPQLRQRGGDRARSRLVAGGTPFAPGGCQSQARHRRPRTDVPFEIIDVMTDARARCRTTSS
jgi:circadian clock protein KaiC